MLTYWTALMLDSAEQHPDAEMRHAMHEQVGLMTPIVKAMLTEQGFLGTSQALQVFGGHGVICETGIEQIMRDTRVTMMYEGSNEIQAIDFLLRKVLPDGGRRLECFLAQVEQTASLVQTEDTPGQETLPRHAAQVLRLVSDIRAVTQAIAQGSIEQADLPYRIAPEMLRLVGHCALAWLWLRATRVALQKEARDVLFYRSKRATACYYFTYVLPEVEQLLGVINGCLHNLDSAAPSAFPPDLISCDAA